MPKFSQDSFSKLSACHSDLQVLFYEVIKTCDCTILEGYRNQVDQEKAFESGHSRLHWPDGKHNKQPSMAVDVAIDPIDFYDHTRCDWFAGYVMGIAQKLKDDGKMTHGIRWGGSWNGLGSMNTDTMLNDLMHFELID